MACLQNTATELMLTNPGARFDECLWFAIQTRPRHEKKVRTELEKKGITVFLPLLSEKRQWSDRRRLVETPLFPQYVFVRIARAVIARIGVLRTNGVVGFVGARGLGTSIPDDQIERIQTVITQDVPFAPHAFLRVGKRIRIREGSLAGLEGILTCVNGDRSLVVSVELIQRSIAMRIEGYEVDFV
jgi:transcription elongation factor/antiterminator RfaH